MTHDEILKRVSELAAEQVGVPVEQIAPATHFVNDLSFDSLDAVEYSMELEDEFSISIPDEQIEKMATVEDAVEYVEQNLHAAA